jgi:hypothetical protein
MKAQDIMKQTLGWIVSNICSVVLFSIITLFQARADVIVYYDNPLKDGTSISFDSSLPQPPITNSPLVTASDLRNTGVLGVDHIEMYQTDGWPAGPSPDPLKHIFFSVAPLPGYQIEFTSFDIDLWQSGGPDNTRQFSLRWDLDGFSSDLITGRIVTNIYMTSYSFSLASLSSRTNAAEFRLYFYDSALNGQNASIIAMGSAGNGFKVHGTVTALPPVSYTVDDLIALVNESGLSAQRKHPLLVTLEAARASLAAGRVTAAGNQLHAFQNKVRAQVAKQNGALADTLTTVAQAIIDSVCNK